MRKFIFPILFLLSSLSIEASMSGVFDVDYQQIRLSFSEIDKVEKYVHTNPGTTFTDLERTRPELAERVEKHASLSYTTATAQGPIGIPSFLWGCVLGVIGILIVYLVSRDSAETTSALWGCIVGAVFWTIIGFSFDLFSGIF